jgi:hypothetical protein
LRKYSEVHSGGILRSGVGSGGPVGGEFEQGEPFAPFFADAKPDVLLQHRCFLLNV